MNTRNRSLLIIMIICICMLAVPMSGCVRAGEGTGDSSRKDTETDVPEQDFGYEELDDEDILAEGEELSEEFELKTLEDAAYILKEDGYVRTATGYQAEDEADGIKSVRKITVKGNNVIVDLSYDYGSDEANREMQSFFKSDQDNAVSIMAASFLTRLADEANAEEGTMEYVITVGGKKVVADKMSLSEAYEYEAMADEEGL